LVLGMGMVVASRTYLIVIYFGITPENLVLGIEFDLGCPNKVFTISIQSF
jgi:hypothetical protein